MRNPIRFIREIVQKKQQQQQLWIYIYVQEVETMKSFFWGVFHSPKKKKNDDSWIESNSKTKGGIPTTTTTKKNSMQQNWKSVLGIGTRKTKKLHNNILHSWMIFLIHFPKLNFFFICA